jgi:hypothetical protein
LKTYYPTFAELSSGSNKQRLFTFGPCLESHAHRIALFLFLTLVVIIINLNAMPLGIPDYYRWLSLVPIGVGLNLLRVYYNDIYILGAEKISREHGRISFFFSVPSINYSDIRGIIVQQGFWGRLLDFGNVLLGTAAYEGHELVLEGVKAPNELASLIEEFRKSNQINSQFSDE